MNTRLSIAWLLMVLTTISCGDERTVELVGQPTSQADPIQATDLVELYDLGTWLEYHPEVSNDIGIPIIRGWVAARVVNHRYHKRIIAEIDAPYANGARIRTLVPLIYEAPLSHGRERWGTDSIELYPRHGPGGSSLRGGVGVRLRIQHTSENGPTDKVSTTPWTTLHGDEPYQASTQDPWPADLSSPVHVSEQPPTTRVYFAPFDDLGEPILAQIQAVIAAQKEQPTVRHTLHAAVFNLSDPEIVQALIEAHQCGVEVRLVTEATKLRPWYHWMHGDDALLTAGVPLLGVRRRGRGAMHMKLALFDGRVASTGSANWQPGARHANHENYIETTETSLVNCYAQRFTALAGGVLARSECENARFGPDEPLHTWVGHIIDEASTSLEIAMFTAKAFTYRENERETSLFTKLIEAVERGVEVTLVTDHGIAEASEYYGHLSDDDPTDEWLEERGVRVIRADNNFGRYASMHHKFMIVDRERVLTGAYNWYYDSSFLNDEDILVLDTPNLVSQFAAEFLDLIWRYGSDQEQLTWPSASVDLSVLHDQTRWGDELYVLGSLPELGEWKLEHALHLEPNNWPSWQTTLHLPAGVRFEWKLLIHRADGSWQWESGYNRQAQTPLSGGAIDASFR